MATQKSKYKALHASELLIRKPRVNGCRVSVTLEAADYATLGEVTTNADGSRFRTLAKARTLRRMRAATGEPDRPGFNQSHVATFVKELGLPRDVYSIFNRPWADIKNALDGHNVISIAGNNKHTPVGSTLRINVNPVAHQILLTEISSDGKTITFSQPMDPDADYKLRRAPASEVKAFASEFRSGGRYTAEKYRIGSHTVAAIEARKAAARIARIKTDAAEAARTAAIAAEQAAQTAQDGYDRELERLDEQILMLESQLIPVDAADEAGYARALDRVDEAVALLRDDE